ncbi:hypothetical protein [Actinophytocola algeriensis]|uniref:Septal ring factor EnvC (AmiA/AmiB activator) n=1 Tax=Actinophytocola algeriensis TaxID=1768010 RepID=A0A7W7PYW6_9PSEU|nr:hypothetical protein [Actinophytocola algeriensis]MBB4903814.1 septal ring factor EnvC (AmiA/AmiB activator) [Actinophytocola algeriensis]MBE1477329.1 septal ring factor EnvC (AmiA/AmiB activator) [Actinophytocola algeriensis]
MAFRSTAAELNRQYKQNKNDIEDLYKQGRKTEAKVDTLISRVDGLDGKADNLTTEVRALKSHVEERFDRLERLLEQPAHEHDPSLPPPDVQTLSLLNTKMNVYSRYTLDHMNELNNHKELFTAHDERFAAQDRRFDAIDGQMAEVLSILRSKSA